MIIRPAETYKRTAQKSKLSPELVISIGEIVFRDLLERLQIPKHLAYELDHVGTFKFRHRKYEKKLQRKMKFEPEGQFIQEHTAIPQLIEQFKIAKNEAKQRKIEYRTKEESKDKP